MQFLAAFPHKTKNAHFRLKIADVDRNQEACHMIYIFVRSSLEKVQLCRLHHYRICVTDLG